MVGAISAQSRRPSAYDDGDLQLLTAIANEASIALERANLYERTAMLSRRLFELHRVGLAIAERTELVDVTRLLAESVVGLLKPAVCAIYLDKGGDTLDFAFSTGKPASDVLALPKNTPLMARVLESGRYLSGKAFEPRPHYFIGAVETGTQPEPNFADGRGSHCAREPSARGRGRTFARWASIRSDSTRPSSA